MTGSIVDGDILGAEYYVDDGYIYLRIANENYEVELIPLKRGIAPGVIWLLVILILILAALFTVGGLILKKKLMVSESEPHVENTYAAVPHFRSESGAKEASAELTTLMAVDEEHANDLITDALAKSLISEEHDVVYTSGYKKCIVNLDTVSSVFNANDKIDINSMKEKGIISPEARYVKILGGGVLDKPLHISANSFSLSAAKMIALTGGSAKRVRTQRIRRNK